MKEPFLLDIGTELTPDQDPNAPELTRGVTYRITREIESTAFHSFSYAAAELKDGVATGQLVFVKTPLVKDKTPKPIKARVSHIYETFQSEYEKRDRLALIPDVSHYVAIGQTRVNHLGTSYQLPFLVQNFIDGPMLDQYYEKPRPDGGPFTGLSSGEWFHMARRIVSVLRRVHNQQIVHGDISPRNILIVTKDEEPTPYIVDFGQSFLADQDQIRPGAPTKKIKPYRAPERDKRHPWRLPADIYSVGAILYFLATGTNPPDAVKKARRVSELKRIIREGVRKQNPNLVRANEGIITIIDKCLRIDPHDRYFCAEHIVADLETFRHKPEDKVVGQVGAVFDDLVGTVRKNALEARNPFFEAIILKHLDMLGKHSESMRRDHFEIFGDRDEIIDHLCRYISTLREGDEYVTVTQPSFWKKHNLGINGRFFTMNKIMARRGVKIRRVFILTKADIRRQEEMEILRAHKEAAKELEDQRVIVTKQEPPPGWGVFYAGYLMYEPHKRHDYFEREGHHVGIWRKADGTMMSLIFSSRPVAEDVRSQPGNEQIVKVRFWVSSSLQEPYNELKKLFNASKPLDRIV